MAISAIDQVLPTLTGKEAKINELFDGLRSFFLLQKHHSASTGLGLTLYGGRFEETDLADQSLTLPVSETSYIEADPVTGELSQNTSSYTLGLIHLGIAITDADGLVSYVAEAPVLGVGGGGGGVALTDVNVWNANQSVEPVALTDGSSIPTDASASNNFKVTLGGNRTLANPTNLTEGMWLTWDITQDGTGSRTLAYGSKFLWQSGIAGVLSLAAGAKDTLSAKVDADLNLRCEIGKAYS